VHEVVRRFTSVFRLGHRIHRYADCRPLDYRPFQRRCHLGCTSTVQRYQYFEANELGVRATPASEPADSARWQDAAAPYLAAVIASLQAADQSSGSPVGAAPSGSAGSVPAQPSDDNAASKNPASSSAAAVLPALALTFLPLFFALA
jgi:hypothetical protein